jgi:hypothetical protein
VISISLDAAPRHRASRKLTDRNGSDRYGSDATADRYGGDRETSVSAAQAERDWQEWQRSLRQNSRSGSDRYGSDRYGSDRETSVSEQTACQLFFAPPDLRGFLQPSTTFGL